MSNNAVIGLGFGDEGKGVVTEYLCSQRPKDTIVVRFSGGQQASHKVIKGNVEHVFSQFGSGTLSGCPTYWSKYCTFDPAAFYREFRLLAEKGVKPKFFIHPDCAVTTPYDVFANRMMEKNHGTCGTGVFRTKKRHFTDGLMLKVKDMPNYEVIMKDIKNYYGMEKLAEEGVFRFCARKLDSCMQVTDTIPEYKHKVFEGSQGLMLDEHIGYMPHCTPSDITPRNAMKMGKLDEVYLVTRCYQTRHGIGPMTNLDHPVHPTNNEKETNTYNRYQGEFRTTVLDLDQLQHAKLEGIDKVVPEATKVNLVMTCTDQVSEYTISMGSSIYTFINVDEFTRFIGKSLRINGDLYANASPRSDIRLVSKVSGI